MFVLDMHCDSLLAVNAESGLIKPYNFSNKYPHLQFVAEFCPKSNEDPFTRRKRLMRLLDLYLYECERLGISQIKSVKDLIRFEAVGGTHALLSIEGGGGLFADSEELPTLMNAGLFVMGLAWDDNELSKSAWCSEDTGLTDKGRELTKRAEELGIIIDVSHLADKAFYDALENADTVDGMNNIVTDVNIGKSFNLLSAFKTGSLSVFIGSLYILKRKHSLFYIRRIITKRYRARLNDYIFGNTHFLFQVFSMILINSKNGNIISFNNSTNSTFI